MTEPSDTNIQLMINEVNTLGRNLTSDEHDFMAATTDRWTWKRQLSPGERRKLQKIYLERV